MEHETKVGNLCILCGQNCNEDQSQYNLHSWEKLQQQALQWDNLDKFGNVYRSVNWEAGCAGIYFHKSCKITLASSYKLKQSQIRKQKYEEDLATPSISGVEQQPSVAAKRDTRTSSGEVHNKNLCIWCMKGEDKKHPKVARRLRLLQTLAAWNSFKNHTVFLEDSSMRSRILTAVETITDPFAVEIRYHDACWKKYVAPVYSEQEDSRLHLQQVRLSEIKIMFLEHVNNVVFVEHELRTLQSLLIDYKNLLQNFGYDVTGKKSSSIKQLLAKEFGDKIGFHTRHQKNESEIVFDLTAGGNYIESAINCWDISDDQLIQCVAKRLKRSSSEKGCINWPPDINSLEQDEAVSPELVKFLSWLKYPTKQVDDDCYVTPEMHAIASILFSYITGKRTSFQIKLSVTLHGITRCKELLGILKKFNLGISYNDVLHLYDTWCLRDLELNAICPKEIAEGFPGVAIIDNDDFKDDTLTGGNTSHRTNIMFVQPEDIEMTFDIPEELSIPNNPNVVKDMVALQHKVEPYKTMRRGFPTSREEIDTTPSSTLQQKKRNVIHSCVRVTNDLENYSPETQKTGAFSGFQATINKKVTKSKPYYFLTFPKPPNKSVIHEAMCRVAAAADYKLMPFIVFVGDQPVYTLIVELKIENPNQFLNIVPFLAPFHGHCSFMYAIYKRFTGSGLSEILVAADVIADGSVEQALRGKHYKRGIRCLKLMYETLLRRLEKHAKANGIITTEALQENLNKLRQADNYTVDELIETYIDLESNQDFEKYVDELFKLIQNSNSDMADYWGSFMEMVEILMFNIHSLRTQNWPDFKLSIRLMLPWLHIYDNDKYGKWLLQFWLEMTTLSDEQTKYFCDGLFAQSISGKAYSCVPLDLWIEMTMNKGSKMKSGWVKILKNEKLLLSSSRNTNVINRVRSCLHSLANSKVTRRDKHEENTPSRRKKDEKAVQDIDLCLTEFKCDPFDEAQPILRSLQSGFLAPKELVIDFQTAKEDGEKSVETFFQERMFSNEKGFSATFHRNNRCSFNKLPVIQMQQAKTLKTDAMENKAMACIITLAAESQQKLTLEQVMDFRVTDECLSIFNINGSMKKCVKSKLVEKLNKDIIRPMPEKYTAIIDMGFLWRLATPSAEDREKADGSKYTWSDYAMKLFHMIQNRHTSADRIIMVNDPYDSTLSIKDSEHERRSTANFINAEATVNVYPKSDIDLPPAKEFSNFFCNKSNKIRLQNFLKQEFTKLAEKSPQIEFIYSVSSNCNNLSNRQRLPQYECAQSEADTIIFYIYSQIRKASNLDLVVIDAEDTDVIVLSAYVANSTNGSLGIKRNRDVINCQNLCSKEIADILIPLHVHTGCDTTSSFFGHGKKAVYDKGTSTQSARNLLARVGKQLPVSQDVIKDLTEFTISYVYSEKKCKTFSSARAKKWEQQKRKSTARIPPDKDSHDLKVARVNYQSFILYNYHNKDAPPSPIGNGWSLKEERCLPLRYRNPALPNGLDSIATGNESSDCTSDSDSTDSDNYTDSE